jgi:hypothetical protein
MVSLNAHSRSCCSAALLPGSNSGPASGCLPGDRRNGGQTAITSKGGAKMAFVDALFQGVSMIDHAIMMQAFQMDQQCMAD